jgi:lysylphosphatidylglycerol synthetase-like protein (DUF2156 family)
VLGALQSFLKNPQPSEGEAVSILRMIYVLTFMAQIAVAAVLAGVMAVIAGRQSSGTLLAQILVVMSLVQLPLALLLSIGVSKAGGKQAALSASIMAGVLLSIPAWFIALTFLVSSTFLYMAILFAILMLYYAVGFMLCGRWAKVALEEEKQESAQSNLEG